MPEAFDAGQIIDGFVLVNESDHLVIRDDEGNEFAILDGFRKLRGQKIRMTLVSFETLDNIKKFLENNLPGT